jgi:hypothetical protein
MAFDASNPRHVKAMEKAAKDAETARLGFLQFALSTEGGRRWFYDTLAACHVFSSPWSESPARRDFLCGEHNIGIRIMADIMTANPSAFTQMMEEHYAREYASAQRSGKPQSNGGTASPSVDDTSADLDPDDAFYDR